MINTINVNYMTGAVTNVPKSTTQKALPCLTFGATLRTAYAAQTTDTVEICAADAAAAVSTVDMTMDEYKQYVFDQISSFQIAPSRARDQYSISISDAGFQAMKDDPDYEKWVLDYIRKDMACPAPGWYTAIGGPPACCILSFGATKEQRSGRMFSIDFGCGQGQKIFDDHADESFWTTRVKRHKKLLEEAIERADQRHMREQALMEAAAERSAAYRKAISQYHSQMVSQSGQSVFPMPQAYFSIGVSAAELLEILL